MAGCRKWRDDLEHGWPGSCPLIQTDVKKTDRCKNIQIDITNIQTSIKTGTNPSSQI